MEQELTYEAVSASEANRANTREAFSETVQEGMEERS